MKKITVKDKLYKKAKVIVLQDQNCSISYIQRSLEIGYSRAALIAELLDIEGVISTPDRTGIRKII